MNQIEDAPVREKVSPAACLGGRTCRPFCTCCGGNEGVRAAFRRPDNSKDRRKNHRKNQVSIRQPLW